VFCTYVNIPIRQLLDPFLSLKLKSASLTP
jgi:hypothetical protein